MSVQAIREKFRQMDSGMREFIKRNNLNNPRKLGEQVSRNWAGLFKKHLSPKAAADLAKHYMNLHGKAKRGGSNAGAPLDYVMRPGMPAVATYATFPTEVGADPKAVQDLDVYYNSALGRSCGTENTTARVAPDMGSNQVPAKGGSHRRTRRRRGGNFLLAMNTRPYTGSNPSGFIQQGAESWYGVGPFKTDSADPALGIKNMTLAKPPGMLSIDPSKLATGNQDVTIVANPSPYPAVRQ
jgi:hypothetical protein